MRGGRSGGGGVWREQRKRRDPIDSSEPEALGRLT